MGMQHSISIRATRHALVLAILLPAIAAAQRPVSIAPNAPEDRGPSVTQCQWDSVVKAMEPLVQQARTTYPSAKVRFLRGLPANQSFFVTARLGDARGHREQVFVVVDSIPG